MLILCQMRSPEEAFQNSVECITGPISRVISKDGMPALYNMLDAEGKKVFEQVRVPLAGPVALAIFQISCCWSMRAQSPHLIVR